MGLTESREEIERCRALGEVFAVRLPRIGETPMRDDERTYYLYMFEGEQEVKMDGTYDARDKEVLQRTFYRRGVRARFQLISLGNGSSSAA